MITVDTTPPDTLSIAEIDREVKVLSAALDSATSIDVATAYATRREALHRARPLAVVRENARARQQELDAAKEARETFAMVEADVAPALRAQAAALDAWVSEGRRLV